MKSILKTCFLFFIFIQIIIAQPLSSKIFHPLSNAFGITLEAGGTIPKTDYKIDELDFNGRLLLEYYFSSRSIHVFGLRLIGGGGFIKGEVFSNEIVYPPVSDNFRTGFLYLGGGIVYALRLGNGIPYISAMTAYTAFDPMDENGYRLHNNELSIYKKECLLYSGEAGVRFPFGDLWSLNVGANINFSNTDYLEDIKTGNNNDAFIGFFTGVSFYLGKNVDTDNDGVDDEFDLCPDTPEGTEVDEFGCGAPDINSQEIVYDALKDHLISDGIFTDGNSYCFQADIFSDLNKAEELHKKIDSLGYKADIFATSIGSRVWYSVRIGYFNSVKNTKYYRDEFFKKANDKLK